MFLPRFLFLLSTLPLFHSGASAYDNQVGFILSSAGESQVDRSYSGGTVGIFPIELFLERHVDRFEFGLKPGIINLIQIQTQSKTSKYLSPSIYFGYSVWQGYRWGFTPEIEFGYRYYRERDYYGSFKSEDALIAPGGKFHFQAGHFKMAAGNAIEIFIPMGSNNNSFVRRGASANLEMFFQIGFLFDMPEQEQ